MFHGIYYQVIRKINYYFAKRFCKWSGHTYGWSFVAKFIYLYSYSSIYIHIHVIFFTFRYLFSHSCCIFTFIVIYAWFCSFICSCLDQPVVHLKFPDDVMLSITRILAIILHCKMNGSVGAAECRSLCTRKVIGSGLPPRIFSCL